MNHNWLDCCLLQTLNIDIKGSKEIYNVDTIACITKQITIELI